MPNSDCVIDFLRERNHGVRSALLVDVKDLFYSVGHEPLFKIFGECIGYNGVVPLQRSCGFSGDHFLEILTFYLKNIFMSLQRKLFVQRRGICIGSRVAAILCSIFLSTYGRNSFDKLRDRGSLKFFKFVDEFLVLSKTAIAASGEIEITRSDCSSRG